MRTKRKTLEERISLYIKGTDWLLERSSNSEFAICGALRMQIIGGIFVSNRRLMKMFPEIALFKPADLKIGDFWFGKTTIKENQELRALVLMFAAEMCNP